MERFLDSAKALVSALKEQKKILTTAESLTGGMLASAITMVPGASDVFEGGLITYSNRLKDTFLSTEDFSLADTIEKAGTAVDMGVALYMAKGALMKTGANIAIATTGLAGPGGDGINPVGTVFVVVMSEKHATCEHLNLKNISREEVRIRTVSCALTRALEFTQKNA